MQLEGQGQYTVKCRECKHKAEGSEMCTEKTATVKTYTEHILTANVYGIYKQPCASS